MPHTRLVELSPDALFVNCDSKFVFANPAAARLLGFSSPSEMIGLPVLRFIRADYHEVALTRIRRALANREPNPFMEQVWFRKDATEVSVSVSAVGFEWEGRPAVEVCARDITAQKEMERLLRDAKETSEQGALSKSRLVSAVSHDLRQSLQSLSLFASVIATDPNLGPQSQVALNRLCESIDRMGELLASILDLAKLDVGLIMDKKKRVQVAALLSDLVAEMAPQAHAKGLGLRWVPTSALIQSDPSLLMTVLRNLVANAIRYTEAGGVLLGVRHRGDHVVIAVYDTGIGIDADKLKLVFEEFYQVGNKARDTSLGLGLGLSIVDRMTRLLGHSVVVRSAKGRGSMFGIAVPTPTTSGAS